MKFANRLPPGLTCGLFSYFCWGFFPIYWKLLKHVPTLEILLHRMIWSFIFYLGIFLFTNRSQVKNLHTQSFKDWILSATASFLLAINWGVYIYAVNTGHILDGSLAYFLNPLLNVAVGVLFFREPFPLVLKLAVSCAGLGVGLKIFHTHHLPLIALTLAITFCAYGVTKKLSQIPARTSSVLEGSISALPALGALLWLKFGRTNAIEPLDISTYALLIGGGVVTGLPLFLFSYAAQRIPYSVMGILQFIAPSLQFMVAVAIYNEPLGTLDLITFGFIWTGLIFYLAGLRNSGTGFAKLKKT